VTVGRAAFGLPYLWSKMSVRREGEVLTYESRRRWPGPHGAHSRIVLRVGDRVGEPTDLEHFLTARWGLHSAFFGGSTLYLPNRHPRWPLHRAELLDHEEDLIEAAGLPKPFGAPVSVLYSPGVPVEFGRPGRGPAGIPTP
jgi:uncharacterized protein YqjF (DUF2071 family)